MSAIGGAFARGVASLGGPQIAAAIVVGGIVVGGLGGAYVASRSSGSSAVPSGELAVYPCPDQGPALMSVKGGQKLLVTGRTEDGTWLRIHYPLPGRTEAWVQTSPLTVDGATASLPVVTCQPELAIASPDAQPGPTLTAVANFAPSPPPAVATPTAAPTASPSAGPTVVQNAKPSLTALAASTSKISYDTASYCPTAVKKVTVKVKASDASGLTGVMLFWREPGAATYAQSAMARTAGSANSGTWQVTLDTTANGITRAGKLAFYTVGTDTAGATGRLPASGASSITVAVCANTGPTITSVSPRSGSTLYWVPAGATGNCPAATNIIAAVKDPDGVKSVTLFFRRPGSNAWSSKTMDNQTVPGKWYSYIDTSAGSDSISTTGTLSWYIKAVDGKNGATQSKSASIKIRRCDSPAVFSSVSTSSSLVCASKPTYFYATVSDPDGLKTTSAVLVYTYVLADGSQRTAKSQMTYTDQSGARFFYDFALTAGSKWSLARTPMTYYVQTTDLFGGVSKSGASKVTVTNC